MLQGLALTMANGNQNYSVLTLLKAAYLADVGASTDGSKDWWQTEFDELHLQADPDDVSGAKFYIGDVNMDATHYGVKMQAKDAWPYGPDPRGGIFIDDLYIRCDTAAKKFLISGRPR